MILASLDPGSRSSSLAILSVETSEDGAFLPPARGRVRPSFCATRTVGHREDLPEPITTTRVYTDRETGEKKTRSFTQTWRWVSSPAENRAHARELFGLLVAHGAAELVVEQNPVVHVDASNKGASQIATNLRAAAGIVESLATLCDQAGIAVHYLSLPSWRARVAGKAHATDADAREGVGRFLDPDGPVQPETEHEVDALGCLLGFLLPSLRDRPERKARLNNVRRSKGLPSPRRKRKPGEPRYPSKQDPSYQRKLASDRANQKAKVRERRKANGCICLAKRGHTDECWRAQFKARQGST